MTLGLLRLQPFAGSRLPKLKLTVPYVTMVSVFVEPWSKLAPASLSRRKTLSLNFEEAARPTLVE
jgi:hypothetical protein